jgi:hypothetical protein
MNRQKRHFHKLPLAAAAVASLLTSAVWAAPQSVTVTAHAADMQARSEHYSQLAAFYRERAQPGSKHMITYFTAANRADRLSEHYRLAAAEASHRG